jgi:hypothetical protein
VHSLPFGSSIVLAAIRRDESNSNFKVGASFSSFNVERTIRELLLNSYFSNPLPITSSPWWDLS